MKQLPIFLLGTTLAFSACKKDYTCSCRVVIPADTLGNFIVRPLDSSVVVDIHKSGEEDAKTKCGDTKSALDMYYFQYTKRTVGCGLNK
jgi:hypothetical protein